MDVPFFPVSIFLPSFQLLEITSQIRPAPKSWPQALLSVDPALKEGQRKEAGGSSSNDTHRADVMPTKSPTMRDINRSVTGPQRTSGRSSVFLTYRRYLLIPDREDFLKSCYVKTSQCH